MCSHLQYTPENLQRAQTRAAMLINFTVTRKTFGWYLNLFRHHDESYMKYRIIQVGRDLRRSPSPSSCYEVRTTCLGLEQVWSWRPPRMEARLCLWSACSSAWLSSWGRRFFSWNIFQLKHVSSHLPTKQHHKKPILHIIVINIIYYDVWPRTF